MVPKEAAPVKDSVADAAQALEPLREVSFFHGFVEKQGQRSLQRLARALVGMGIVGQELDQVVRGAVGSFDPTQADGVFDNFEEEA